MDYNNIFRKGGSVLSVQQITFFLIQVLQVGMIGSDCLQKSGAKRLRRVVETQIDERGGGRLAIVCLETIRGNWAMVLSLDSVKPDQMRLVRWNCTALLFLAKIDP
jgi:hypothetical protein